MVPKVTLIQYSKMDIVTKFHVFIFKNYKVRETCNNLAHRQHGIGLMIHEDITNFNIVGYILYGIGTIMATLLVLNYVQETETIYYYFYKYEINYMKQKYYWCNKKHNISLWNFSTKIWIFNALFVHWNHLKMPQISQTYL